MGRTACTEPQCLYMGDLYLLHYTLGWILVLCYQEMKNCDNDGQQKADCENYVDTTPVSSLQENYVDTTHVSSLQENYVDTTPVSSLQERNLALDLALTCNIIRW